MAGTFRIGRLFGFEISVHWSWFFIFVLVTWTFAAGVLNDVLPGLDRRPALGRRARLSLVFFLSILLHEMSHSIVARRYGIPVSSITLFVFGGVSNLTQGARQRPPGVLDRHRRPADQLAIGVCSRRLLPPPPVDDGAGGVSANLA